MPQNKMNGFWTHFVTTLKLNFRNKQAVVFGYVVPVFFLLAFGSIFVRGSDSLENELGQLLTISVLGGACFGMPVTFVTERERGVWRRYKLAPMGTAWFVLSLMLARYVIVATAALMQVFLAKAIYHNTPWPKHPWQLWLAFTLVCWAFLGIGLLISMISNSAGAVQALGQSIFLPMIIIGGVGVPLTMLPHWGRHVAAFLPGRYAVEAMDQCISDRIRLMPSLTPAPAAPRGKPPAKPATSEAPRRGLLHRPFDSLALLVIGAAGLLAGAKLFRWENLQRLPRGGWWWALVAVAAWAAVGLMAERLGIA